MGSNWSTSGKALRAGTKATSPWVVRAVCPPPVLGGTAWKKSWKIVPPIPRFVGQAEVKCKEQHRECHPLIPTSSMASPGWLVMGSHWGKEGYSLLYPLREGLCGYHKVIADAH